VRALKVEHPAAAARPKLSEWLRNLAVARSTRVLKVSVTRTGLGILSGGATETKRRELAKAVRAAAHRRQCPPSRR
jgi:hypothetical protein